MYELGILREPVLDDAADQEDKTLYDSTCSIQLHQFRTFIQ